MNHDSKQTLVATQSYLSGLFGLFNSCYITKGYLASVHAIAFVVFVVFINPHQLRSETVYNATTYEDDLFTKYTASQLNTRPSLTAAFNGSTELISSQSQTLSLTTRPDAFAFQVSQVTGYSVGNNDELSLNTSQWVPTLGLQSITNPLGIVNFGVTFTLSNPLMRSGNALVSKGYTNLPGGFVTFAGGPDYFDNSGREGFFNVYLINDPQQVDDIYNFIAANPTFYPVFYNDQGSDYGFSRIGTFTDSGASVKINSNGSQVNVTNTSLGAYFQPLTKIDMSPVVFAQMSDNIIQLVGGAKNTNKMVFQNSTNLISPAWTSFHTGTPAFIANQAYAYEAETSITNIPNTIFFRAYQAP